MENEPIDFFQDLKVLITDYLTARVKLLKYELFEKAARITASLFSSIVIVMLAFLMLFFLSIALGFYLGEMFNSFGTGFMIVTGIYFVMLIPFIFFRKIWIEKLIVNRMIAVLTEKEEDEI
jgi:hypothetical protein